jgi:hypothetical protein
MLVSINNDIEIPILYIGSENDDIVPINNKPVYKNEQKLFHDKGHKLPTQKVIIRQIIEFINKN